MKKIIATIMSVILLLTIAPMACAEENNTYKEGDIIQFGSYPQSEVKDETLIAELNVLAPEWDDWTSYGYYSGNGEIGSMVQGDWMRYVDVTYDGSKYRGVKFTQYRSFATICFGNESDAQYLNGYRINEVYWFEFQPILWRVLDPDKGFVLSEIVLDSQAYNNEVFKKSDEKEQYAYYNDSSYTNYANDYANSSIRRWLNDDFYNLAFTDVEKLEISVTECNNDNYWTLKGWTDYQEFNSATSYDKIFLLSSDEIKNTNYGFYNGYTNDIARRAPSTNYAKSQGIYFNSGDDFLENSPWLIRTPDINSAGALFVDQRGFNNCYSYSYYSHTGVRPALMLKDLSKIVHSHKFFTTVTAPTCTGKGYTTYTCECGETYVSDYTDVVSHNYTVSITTPATHLTKGLKTFTCSSCGDSYTESIAKIPQHSYTTSKVTKATCTEQGYVTYFCDCGDSYTDSFTPKKGHTYNGQTCIDCGDNCSCNCHKGGISGFFWKIINFFNKLFKNNQECKCGAKHW